MDSTKLIQVAEVALTDKDQLDSVYGDRRYPRRGRRQGPNVPSRLWSDAITLLGIKGRSVWSFRGSSRTHRAPSRARYTSWKIVLEVFVAVGALFLGISVWHALFNDSYANVPRRYQDMGNRIALSTRPGRANINNEKVFIAANIVNEQLIRGAWGDNLVSLVDLLGEENVFVSIYENDSGNGTSDALRQLQQRLKCNSSVVAGDHVALSELPTIRTANGEDRVQRLAYLAEVRNRLLRPIDPWYSNNNSSPGFRTANNIVFDKVLFLNDVYYSPLEAAQLLFLTNAESGRAQYRAACALDFVQWFKLYDTFVVRDTDGFRIPLQFFPWFTYRGSGTSRGDVLSLRDAVRVRSCWGGMAAFDAKIFRPRREVSPPPQDNMDHVHAQPQLKFRSDGEPFWEAAECCLIFADMEQQFGTPSEVDGTGVFINPHIRTAYSRGTWRWIPFFKRFERALEPFQRLTDFIKAPEWNPRRLHEPGQMVDELVWTNSSAPSHLRANPHCRGYAGNTSGGHFEVQHRPARAGGFCGQRRMFVMKQDIEAANKGRSGKNWENLPVPWHFELSGS